MRVDIRRPIELGIGGDGAYGWVPLVMLAIGVPWGIWSFATLLWGGSQTVAFGAAVGWFILLAIGYIGLQGRSGAVWWSVPVLLTLRALLEFIGTPVWRFATGGDLLDSVYVHAMFLTVIGFAAFWAGSLLFMKETRLHFVPQVRDKSSRVAFISAAMLVLGVGANLVMWKTGLLSYLADAEARESSAGSLQWLGTCGNLLNAALVVSAIDVFGEQPTEPLMKIVFRLSVVFSVGFGVMTGMKSEILKPLICLALVYSVTKRRLPRTVLLLPVLLVLVIYPFVNAYRGNLNSGYRAQVNTIGGLGAVFEKTFEDVVDAPFSTNEQAGQGVDQASNRLSLLTSVRDIVGLPYPSLLNGDEKVWLAPVYPLVPRFIWKSKPVFNKGQRTSQALGRPSTTSSALTPIGDLYSLYGTLGVVVGMLIYGICLQLYMNRFGHGGISEKGLFFYISMLMPLINLELDVVSLVAGTIQMALIMVVTAYVIYGPSVSSAGFAKHSTSTVVSA